ncbi:hypothetical protein ABZP36_000386 [Zizania latifolia]
MVAALMAYIFGSRGIGGSRRWCIGRRGRPAGTAAPTPPRRPCCPVCLENYSDRDVLRVLPDCGHLFQRECVDPWLRQRPTCPVCLTSPAPCRRRSPRSRR